MRPIEIPSNVLFYSAWGTIVVISLTIVLSLLAILLNLRGAPLPMPVLHVANLMCLANIILMCMQKKSKVYSVINKITLALLSPAYIFALCMCIVRLLSISSIQKSVREVMLMQNFTYYILGTIMMIYVFLPITVALINSIHIIKLKHRQNKNRIPTQ